MPTSPFRRPRRAGPLAMARRLTIAALAGLLAIIAPAAAEPALWKVEGEGARVYLFGTLHVLRPGTDWRSPEIDAAFRRADRLVLEVDILRDTGIAAMAVHGTSPKLPLSERLDPELLGRLKAAAAEADIPYETLEPLRPWLAAVTLSQAAFKSLGFDVREGVELTLASEAMRRRKPVSGLETAAFQYGIFGGLDPEDDLDVLISTLDDLGESFEMIESIEVSWLAGDVDEIDTVGMADLRTENAKVYDLLIPRRNRAWTEWLVERLSGREGDGETVFVAVGAGHLTGPDSVQAMLAEKGYRAERLNAPEAPADP